MSSHRYRLLNFSNCVCFSRPLCNFIFFTSLDAKCFYTNKFPQDYLRRLWNLARSLNKGFFILLRELCWRFCIVAIPWVVIEIPWFSNAQSKIFRGMVTSDELTPFAVYFSIIKLSTGSCNGHHHEASHKCRTFEDSVNCKTAHYSSRWYELDSAGETVSVVNDNIHFMPSMCADVIRSSLYGLIAKNRCSAAKKDMTLCKLRQVRWD